jgi:hypothetical protein
MTNNNGLNAIGPCELCNPRFVASLRLYSFSVFMITCVSMSAAYLYARIRL